MFNEMKRIKVSLDAAKNILAGVIVLSLGYCFYSSYRPKEYRWGDKYKDKGERGLLWGRFDSYPREDYSGFLREIKERVLFTSPRRGKIIPKEDPNRGKIEKLKNALHLIGVISGEPNVAIIKESISAKTFYLKPGEVFLDDVRVEKVGEGFVVLEYYGESIDLYL